MINTINMNERLVLYILKIARIIELNLFACFEFLRFCILDSEWQYNICGGQPLWSINVSRRKTCMFVLSFCLNNLYVNTRLLFMH